MKSPLKFTLVEIAPFKEFLRLTQEERLRQNDLMVNRLLKLEDFMETVDHAHNFLKNIKWQS
jgi:hypothetical protein